MIVVGLVVGHGVAEHTVVREIVQIRLEIRLGRLSEALLDIGGDRVDDLVQLLVARLLGIGQPTTDMSLDKWHRNLVGSGVRR